MKKPTCVLSKIWLAFLYISKDVVHETAAIVQLDQTTLRPPFTFYHDKKLNKNMNTSQYEI